MVSRRDDEVLFAGLGGDGEAGDFAGAEGEFDGGLAGGVEFEVDVPVAFSVSEPR